jgi:hypothetical protein
VAERYGKVYISHMGASERIFRQGFEFAVQELSPAGLYQWIDFPRP